MRTTVKKFLFLTVTALTLVVAFQTSCSSPFDANPAMDPRSRALALAQDRLFRLDPVLDIRKSVDPAEIYLKDSGVGNETTTVSIGITGFGGTSTSTLPIDVVFAIDSSGSMTGSDSGKLRLLAAKEFVEKLNPAIDRAALVSWDDSIDFTYPDTAPYPNPQNSAVFSTPPYPVLGMAQTMTSDFAALKTQIDLVDADGMTNVALGLIQGIRMIDAAYRADSSNALIFLTDGGDTENWPDPILVSWIQYAKAKGIRIYPIGLGNSVNKQDLLLMASETGGTYFPAPAANNLAAIYDQIFTEIVSFTSPAGMNLIETVKANIVDLGGFSIAPDSVMTDPVTNETTIVWNNVARYVGNGDDRLSADESFSVSYTAKSALAGKDLPVESDAARIVYFGPSALTVSVPVPVSYITVINQRFVVIDVKPDSFPNPINTRSRHGVIPVAIMTTPDFDALSLDPNSVLFEGAKGAHVDKKTGLAVGHPEDVDGDGDLDLMMHFRQEDTALVSSSTIAVLTGTTYDGLPIEGSDSVRMIH